MNRFELEEKDQKFREQVARKDNPTAKRWSALDRKAEGQQQQVERMQSDLEKRQDPTRISHLEGWVHDLSQQRHEMEVLGRPNAFMRKQRAEYDQKFEGLETALKNTRQEIRDWAKQSDPAEVAKHQQQMELKQKELNETVRARQDVARLPSEHAQQKEEAQKQEGEVETPSDRVRAWRKERQKDKEVQVDYPAFGAGKFGGATFAATALGEQKRFKQDEANYDWQKQDKERQNIWRQ